MGSIIEWGGFMSMSDVYIISKITDIEKINMVESWSLCGLRSNHLNSRSKSRVALEMFQI